MQYSAISERVLLFRKFYVLCALCSVFCAMCSVFSTERHRTDMMLTGKTKVLGENPVSLSF